VNKSCKHIWFWGFIVVSMSVHALAQNSGYQKECSEHAKELIKKGWAAQPMNKRENKADPAKAEALYKEALKDSPNCRSARQALVALLLRQHDYQQANEYNEALLQQFPDDPSALNFKADLISVLKRDYTQALEIRMKLLKVEGFNDNGSVFYDIAGTYSLMNKLDESLEYLKLALSRGKGWGNKENAQANSDFENVRKDGRFWSLVNQK